MDRKSASPADARASPRRYEQGGSATQARHRRGRRNIVADDNDIVIEAWNTVLFDKFCRFKHLLIDGLAPHSNEALARHPHPVGARVLDIGCGFGDSTRLIARRVGPSGEAVGIDCAPNFVEAARREAAAGASLRRLRRRGRQVDDLGGRLTSPSYVSARCSS
jgi:SAM-dependent methyltransferase